MVSWKKVKRVALALKNNKWEKNTIIVGWNLSFEEEVESSWVGIEEATIRSILISEGK